MTTAKITAVLFVVLALSAGNLWAEIIIVDNDWPYDFNNIQAAIDYSTNGDFIFVFPGTYTGPGNRDIDFLGKAITVQSVAPEFPDIVATTIIDCNGTAVEPHRGFYFKSSEDGNSILDGITITNGYAPNEEIGEEFPLSSGGGIFCGGSAPVIKRCIITNNSACRGGGIYCQNGSPTVSECVVRENSSYPQSISQGSATWGFSGGGAGLYLDSSSAAISDCIVSNNFGHGGNAHGGGICCYLGNAVIRGCTISNNQVESSGDGGGVTSLRSSMVFERCLFVRNTADDQGGGLSCYKSNVTLSNCVFRANSASGGGAMRNSEDCNATLQNCTLIANSSSSVGGIRSDGSSSVTINSCILYANTDSYYQGEDVQIHGGALSIDYCFIEGWSGSLGGSGNSGLDPLLTLDGHLSKDSPCLDAGDAGYSPNPEETDIDGESRLSNGRVDVGADEYNFTPVVGLSHLQFEFSGTETGPDPVEQILSVTNVGDGSTNWQITGDCPWLHVSPDSGDSTGETDEVTLRVEISGRRAGLYTCELVITAAGAINSPQTVEIRMYIYDADVLYVPSEYSTIQSAVDWAYNGATVIVADGIYTGEGNVDVDLKGKTITVTSQNGPGNCILNCNGADNGFHSRYSEDGNYTINGFTITNASHGAIYCRGTATISNCNALRNYGGGINCSAGSNTTITNCTISDNVGHHGGGIICNDSNTTVANCEVIANLSDDDGGGMFCTSSTVTITNSAIIGNVVDDYAGGAIFSSNCNMTLMNSTFAENAAPYGNFLYCGRTSALPSSVQIVGCIIADGYNEIYDDSESAIIITYSNVQGGWLGLGNIDADPCFVAWGYWDPNGTPGYIWDDFWIDGDYHLKSEGWRWDTQRKVWKWDDVTSRCIDSGNPGCPLGDELLSVPVDPNNEWGENLRINMGAYGGTAEASMPPYDWALLANLTNDGKVDSNDLAAFVDYWLDSGECIPSDLNRNQFVDFVDFALLGQDWYLETSWYTP